MASVNVSDAEFTAVANAANEAAERGDMRAARALDKLARKMNAALAHYSTTRRMGRFVNGMGAKPFTWRDVPSTLVRRRRA